MSRRISMKLAVLALIAFLLAPKLAAAEPVAAPEFYPGAGGDPSYEMCQTFVRYAQDLNGQAAVRHCFNLQISFKSVDLMSMCYGDAHNKGLSVQGVQD